MFSRIPSIIAFIFVFITLAAAGGGDHVTKTVTVTTYAPGSTAPASQCNTGALWCCNDVQTSSGSVVGLLLGLLNIAVAPVTALIGANCSPITVIGGGGNSCSAQPVCCQNNEFSGLVVIGCTPVNLNL